MVSDDQGMTVKLYPNPSSDLFNLTVSFSSTDELHVRVFDALGQLTEEFTQSSGNGSIEFGKNLGQGIYFVNVACGTECKVLRAIKTR